MNEQQEPKPQTVDALVDKLLAPQQTGQQQQESSPVTEESQTTPEGGSDPLKTQSKEENATGDKGFASHPKWQERENKLKEARESLRQRDMELEQYTKLLDDPDVYAKYLKSKGFSDRQIQQAMMEKGHAPRITEQVEAKKAQEISLAQKACKNLGWDISRLTPDQQAHIDDLVSIASEVAKEQFGMMMDKRLGPIEHMTQEWSQQKQFQEEERAVQEIAKEEFPGVDYKVIQEAMQRYCAELDKKDPQRIMKFSLEDLYYRSTRQLLKELDTQKTRQEARDAVKGNARPLGAGPTTAAVFKDGKKMKTHEFLEQQLDARNIR